MKDPAFLFYSSDFLSGTMLMSDEEIGQYIKLLCLQHQKGHLKEKDMLIICKTYNENIFCKFIQDEEGNYYNKRLEEETIKRQKYAESRRNNRKKKTIEEQKEETYEKDMNNICLSYDEHMGNENGNININKIININKDINKKEKHKYGEYKNVLLTDEELQKIKEKYNNWEELIKYLDEYIERKGYKAKSHYLCIGKWVVNAVKEEKQKNQGTPKKGFQEYDQRKYDNLEKFYIN